MKAIVTGAGGFCGRHLCRFLTERDAEVFTLGTRRGGTNHIRIRDTSDRIGIEQALRDLRPDLVFHLAGIWTADDPCRMYEVNSQYALALLQATLSARGSDTRVLLVGSAAEYGMFEPTDLPIREDFPCRPHSHHGISKLSQTLIGLLFAKDGLPVVVTRPGNIIGPGMSHRLFLGSIVKQIELIAAGRAQPVVEVGNLDTARDFIDVQDAVAIYWQLIQTPSAYGRVVNMCTGIPVAIKSVVETAIEISGYHIDVAAKQERFRPYDTPVYYGSTEKLKGLIGYAPRLDLRQSLERVMAPEPGAGTNTGPG